jgi:signal transduction histidine kinase
MIAADSLDERAQSAELERERRRTNTLLELSTLVAAEHDPTRIAALTCDFLRRASAAEYAMLGRRDPGGEGFSIAATSGLTRSQVDRIRRALARTDRPSLRDLLSGSITSRSGEASVGEGMGIAEAMGAPIVADSRTIGFIAIGAPADASVHRDEWQDLLVAFAAVTATALARSEAVHELGRQRDILASEVEERTRSLRTALGELRVASDAKTDFLANVSHELRTPLTAILGFAEILAGGLDGPLTAEQARDIGTIQSSSRHLLELIDDLIDIASIESGRIQLAIGPVDVTDVVRSAADTIRPLAGEKGIALDLLSAPGHEASDPDSAEEAILVVADEGRLREIVLNVLSNAVKFTPSGGSVRVTVRVEPGAGLVAIAVQDTGLGIEAADLERIFEKFVRIAGPAIPGTGLGLPISRELARLHGGDLTVESTPGRGSTFTIRTPVAGPS